MDREIFLRITKPQQQCVLCGAALAEGGKHPSVLLPVEATDADEGEPDIPQRRDYCPSCWQEHTAKDYLGFWITKREAPKPRRVQNRRERNARLAAYFDYFYREGGPIHAARLYFLAHLLMRYGVLRWLRTEHDTESQKETIFYRHVINDEEVKVESVELSDEELVALKREVDELLAGTLGLDGECRMNSEPMDGIAIQGQGQSSVPQTEPPGE
ncbi:MAG: hypothetical protein ACP5QZ_02120 [Candidatus Sumerlaeaceae bacterium]